MTAQMSGEKWRQNWRTWAIGGLFALSQTGILFYNPEISDFPAQIMVPFGALLTGWLFVQAYRAKVANRHNVSYEIQEVGDGE